MRVVVDTNVVVSGLLTRNGIPAQIVDLILSATLTALYDDRILHEYREVLSRTKFQIPLNQTQEFIRFIEDSGQYFSGQRLGIILPDPSDLPFLEVASAGLADALITGNARHFKPTKGRHNVRVCTPAEFIRIT